MFKALSSIFRFQTFDSSSYRNASMEIKNVVKRGDMIVLAEKLRINKSLSQKEKNDLFLKILNKWSERTNTLLAKKTNHTINTAITEKDTDRYSFRIGKRFTMEVYRFVCSARSNLPLVYSEVHDSLPKASRLLNAYDKKFKIMHNDDCYNMVRIGFTTSCSIYKLQENHFLAPRPKSNPMHSFT